MIKDAENFQREVDRMMKLLNVAPLSGGYMITSMVGFIISAMYVFPRSNRWGFTFVIFFTLMFIASMISMTYGPDEAMYHAGHKKHFVSKIKK